tara:strand:+ start:10927 stop:12648 length:1722 start_codon:yes stop_codon:yes gene_type:complete
MPPVLKQSNAGTYVSRFTSDKQKMWEQAMQSVMANYKLDQATYKELMAAYRLATKELNGDIEDSRDKIAKLKEKQITSDAATDRWNTGQKNATTRANTAAKNAGERAKASASRAQRKSAESDTYEDLVSTTGKAIVTQQQFGNDPNDISNTIQLMDNRIQSSTEIPDKTGPETNVMYAQAVKEAVLTETNKGEYAALPSLEAKEAAAKAKVMGRLTPIQRQRAEAGLTVIETETSVPGADVDVHYSGRGAAGGADYGALIKAEEDRLRKLEAQTVASPDAPTIDLIKQTRDEYHDKFSQPDYIPAYKFNEGLQTLSNIGSLPEEQRKELLTAMRDKMARDKGLSAPSGRMTEEAIADVEGSEGYQREAKRRTQPEVQAELAAGREAREDFYRATPEPTEAGGPEATETLEQSFGEDKLPDAPSLEVDTGALPEATEPTAETTTTIHKANQVKVGARAGVLLKDTAALKKAVDSEVGITAQQLWKAAQAKDEPIDIAQLTGVLVKTYGDNVVLGIEGSAILIALASGKLTETMMTDKVEDAAPVVKEEEEEKPASGKWEKTEDGSAVFKPDATE